MSTHDHHFDDFDDVDPDAWESDLENDLETGTEIADQIRDALIEVAVNHPTGLEDFDTDSLRVLGITALTIVEASSPERLRADLAQVLATVFLAGRHHADVGHPSPIPAAAHDHDQPLFVPDDWS